MTPKRARDEWRGREPCFLAIDEMCPVLSLSENGRFTTCSVIFGNFWSFFWVSHLNRAKGVGPPGVGHGCLHPVRHVSNGAWASGSLTKLRKMGSEDGLVCFLHPMNFSWLGTSSRYFLSLPLVCILASMLSPWVRAKYVDRTEVRVSVPRNI